MNLTDDERTVIEVLKSAGAGSSCSLMSIAEDSAIDHRRVSGVVAGLIAAGLVKSSRGGFRLSSTAKALA